MSVAKVIEVSAISTKSFEDAIQVGVSKASKTVKGIKSVWVKDQEAEVKDGQVISYKVGMKVTFVID